MAAKKKTVVDELQDTISKVLDKTFTAAYKAQQAGEAAMDAANELDVVLAGFEEELDTFTTSLKRLGVELPKTGGEA